MKTTREIKYKKETGNVNPLNKHRCESTNDKSAADDYADHT